MVKYVLRKLGFKLSLIETELNLLYVYKKKSVIQPKIRSPLLFIREFSKLNHTQLFCWILDTHNILWICAGGESYAVRARSKTRKPPKFFSNFFSSDFLILTQYWKSKTRKKKTRKKNSRVSEVSEVSEFSICHFLDFLIKCPRFKF